MTIILDWKTGRGEVEELSKENHNLYNEIPTYKHAAVRKTKHQQLPTML